MNRIIRVILLSSFSILLLSCTACSDGKAVVVTLVDDHPWETIAGRRFWYTLVWNDADGGLRTEQLSLGVRKATVMVRPGQTVVFAAYPLGMGIPFGGAYLPTEPKSGVELTSMEGPLAAALLELAKRWPEPVSSVDFRTLSEHVAQLDPTGRGIDWNILAKAVVEGSLSGNAITLGPLRDVELHDIPSGRWVCEYSSYGTVDVYSDASVLLRNLPAGTIRFLNTELELEVRVIIPDVEEEGIFWHAVGMDPLLKMSDAAYQMLLEQGREPTP